MKLLINVLLLFCSLLTYAQSYDTIPFIDSIKLERDTMYHISLNYRQDIPRQTSLSGFCFVKDLNDYRIVINNFDSRHNSFYKNSFYSWALTWEFKRVIETLSSLQNKPYSAYKTFYDYNEKNNANV